MKRKAKTYNLISRHRSIKAGLPPGTLTQASISPSEKVKMTLMEFDENSFSEKEITNQDLSSLLNSTAKIKWLNVDGIHNIDVIEKIGLQFKIHPLTLEDITNTDQRAKFEDYEDYDVAMMRMLYYDNVLHSEQLSIVLLKDLVISFQEQPGADVFDPVRERIRTGKGRVRKNGADYLAYALMDCVVDSYFKILEKIGERMDQTDESLLTTATKETLQDLYHLKREMIYIRKSIWPMRELINNMERSENNLIQPSTEVYLRDLHDHSIRIIETIDTYRDMISGMMDIYHSSLSNRMNEVMKVLTIISTIFIPVTFIAGVYGMNFRYMPELESEWGYPIVWLVMIAIMLTLFIYFKKKKWL